MKHAINIALYLLPVTLLAQTANKPVSIEQVISGPFINSATRTFNLSETALKGSPLAFDNWTPGTLLFKSGNTIANALFNYDALDQEIWVKRSAKDSARYAVAGVKQLSLQSADNNQPTRYEHLAGVVTDETALKTGLVRVVYQGDYSLVQLPVKRFYKAPAKQPYGNTQVFDEFRDESAYFIIRPDKTAERVKLNRKALVSALQSKGAAFETVLKDKKLDAKLEADVVTALGALQ
ncbi:hypothetical protein J2I47_11775 [Fibrella sp. HMF5335]|uniref:GLPGLI family protein n=1 Tax=Fibrella rubiginis TaxID=2817060 RepID=A0A939GG97_9BACT|nr:hypothetical protein [Fibrella rubiginis]MBO0937228.1 hypothetical protein [Fibrella rubiginis]